jgi:hypothetical protein
VDGTVSGGGFFIENARFTGIFFLELTTRIAGLHEAFITQFMGGWEKF